jgi:predicted dehydrogenase
MTRAMTIRWGIIGCGDVCEVKSGPALYKAQGSRLSIVMRRDPERAADFARRHGVPRFTTDADAVITDPEVDIVYVATPPGEHELYALRVARANKPCYIEKPMARNAAECRRMLEAFERAKQPLFVAYYRRALPRFLAVRDTLESGALGQLLAVSHVYQGRAPRSAVTPAAAGWREHVPSSGGGLFVDLGSHVVDLLDFLLGPLEGVHGHAARRSELGRPQQALGERRALAEDTVVMSFRTGSGVLGTGRYQFHTSAAVDRLELVGTRGTLSLSVFGQEPLELVRGDARELIPAPQPEHVHQPLVQSIVDELRGQGRCPSTGASGARASDVIDQVLTGYYGGRADAFWSRPESWPGTSSRE